MAAGKYHVNKITGRTNTCRATKKGCPLGADTPHFESKAEAKAYIEKTEAEQNSAFATVSKEANAEGGLSDLANLSDEDLNRREEEYKGELNDLDGDLYESMQYDQQINEALGMIKEDGDTERAREYLVERYVDQDMGEYGFSKLSDEEFANTLNERLNVSEQNRIAKSKAAASNELDLIALERKRREFGDSVVDVKPLNEEQVNDLMNIAREQNNAAADYRAAFRNGSEEVDMGKYHGNKDVVETLAMATRGGYLTRDTVNTAINSLERKAKFLEYDIAGGGDVDVDENYAAIGEIRKAQDKLRELVPLNEIGEATRKAKISEISKDNVKLRKDHKDVSNLLRQRAARADKINKALDLTTSGEDSALDDVRNYMRANKMDSYMDVNASAGEIVRALESAERDNDSYSESLKVASKNLAKRISKNDLELKKYRLHDRRIDTTPLSDEKAKQVLEAVSFNRSYNASKGVPTTPEGKGASDAHRVFQEASGSITSSSYFAHDTVISLREKIWHGVHQSEDAIEIGAVGDDLAYHEARIDAFMKLGKQLPSIP